MVAEENNVDSNDDVTQRMRSIVHGFIGKLTDGDLFACAAANGVFEASGEWSSNYFMVNLKTAFLHQCIAVEPEFWRTKLRPKLELDFVAKVVTPDMELNAFGFPSDLIIPESVQRRAKNRSKEDPTRPKIELQPGTYVVNGDGVSFVLDRSQFPQKDENEDGPLLMLLPSARIDSLFPLPDWKTPKKAASTVPISGESVETGVDEDETMPVLERSLNEKTEETKKEEEQEQIPKIEINEPKTNGTGPVTKTEGEVATPDPAPILAPVVTPVLAPIVAPVVILAPSPTPAPVLSPAPVLAPVDAPKPEMTLATILNGVIPHDDTKTNGVNGEGEVKKEEETVENTLPVKNNRKSRSRSTRASWTDRMEFPKDPKRVPVPSKRRRDTSDEIEEEKPKRIKERSISTGGRSDGSTPPPLLERQEPTEEKTVKIEKRGRRGSSKRSLPVAREVVKMDDGMPRNIISIKLNPQSAHGSTVSTVSSSGRTSRRKQKDEEDKKNEQEIFERVTQAESNRIAAENNRLAVMDPEAPCSSRQAMNPNLGTRFRGSIIGVKPPPKELNGLMKETPRAAPRSSSIPSKKGRYEEDSPVKKEEEEEEEEELVMRQRTPPRIDGPLGEDCDQNCSPTRRKPDRIINVVIGETDPKLKERNDKIMQRVSETVAHREEQQGLLVEKLKRAEEQKSGVGYKMARSEEIVVEKKKDEGSNCSPMYSSRDDDFYGVMMRGDSEKNNQYYTRSLKEIYEPSREFYQSLMRDEPCKQWKMRPRVGPDVDGYVHQCSGATVKVANGAEMTKYNLRDLHNHREFRLGEIVWAKFQREYWPGYIKAFLPADLFEEYKGDAIMVQWISDDELFSHVCYSDVYRFDFYFAIMYLPQKVDKLYVSNVAKAVAMDGRPGFWEEYINKSVFDQIVAIGGNVHSMPAEQLERLNTNAKMKGIATALYQKLLKQIHEKEINHFQHFYKAIYAGRNQTKWSPNQELCNEKLSFTRPYEEPEEKVEKKRGRPKARKSQKEGSTEKEDETEDDVINPSHSPFPLFAGHITEVNVIKPDGEVLETHTLFDNANRSPLSDTLEEPRPADLGAHGYMSFGPDETARLAAYLKKSKQDNEKMVKEEGEQELPRSETQEDPLFAVAVANSSAITAHEVLNLMDEPQTIYDKFEAVEDKEWDTNSRVCAHHLRVEFEIKEQKIKEHNEKIEEKRRLEGEKKALAQQKKEEKAAMRQARNGPIVVPVEKWHSRYEKKNSESNQSTPNHLTPAQQRAKSAPGRPKKIK